MPLIRPRLNDYFDISLTEADADFAIPFLDEDIPFCVDPFLLWKSPSFQDNSLHTALVNSFNNLGYLVNHDKESDALQAIITASECNEVGLGTSKTRRGVKIGVNTATSILQMFKNIPQVHEQGFVHFEEIQLFVDGIGKDRIGDFTCSFLKSFLIDFTIDQAEKYKIPMQKAEALQVYNYKTYSFVEEDLTLPFNPETNDPVIFVPKRWLRTMPWINYDDFYQKFYIPEIGIDENNPPEHITILNFNRSNYDFVQAYVASKERTQVDCQNDPLFRPIPVLSAKRKFDTIQNLPSGNQNKNDKQYEDNIVQLMASLLYPHLDFAADQSRTESGSLIRDLIFYNSRSLDFLTDIYTDYGSRQMVMELKNVASIEREHINQLNRYLSDQFGRFGIIITRNPAPKSILRNTIDLWSSQRKCIIILTDSDLQLMVTVFESKQRLPIEVIKRAYVDFMRMCPS